MAIDVNVEELRGWCYILWDRQAALRNESIDLNHPRLERYRAVGSYLSRGGEMIKCEYLRLPREFLWSTHPHPDRR
jgi:hypothetical protein